ncbi:cobyrinate a,c-diamide synthase [Pseudomonadota bacterium]
MRPLLISAANKSSGKTMVSVGLCALLAERGLAIQPFKKGPDYIDPMWLSAAAGRSCINLDFHTMSVAEISSTFLSVSEGSSIALIEGNKGLYDGVSVDGNDSSAGLAKLLKAPVVLVINAYGMTRGIAPLLKGYLEFDKQLNFLGVILNNVASTRHESKLRAAVEYYTDLKLLGAIRRNPQLRITERHLGLVPQNEFNGANRIIKTIADTIAEQVDIEALLGLSRTVAPVNITSTAKDDHSAKSLVRIGLARDEVFGFYYPDDLLSLEKLGAELIYIDTIRDQNLPDVDALFFGGGFPEEHLILLHQNKQLRTKILGFIDNGGPVYAECGGLMYLARSISYRQTRYEMVGAIPADVVMETKPSGRGYVYLREKEIHPWRKIDGANVSEIPAHEFHYSRLENIGPGVEYAYDMVRGFGIDGLHDGLIYKNLLANYSHLRAVGGNRWTERFVNHVRSGIEGCEERILGEGQMKQAHSGMKRAI